MKYKKSIIDVDLVDMAGYSVEQNEIDVLRTVISARRLSDVTQQELAAYTGINQSDISRLESGNTNPSLRTLCRIAEGLGKKLIVSFV